MPSRDSRLRTVGAEARRLADAIACVAVVFGVAALLGLDPFGSAAGFLLSALAGGAAYGVILLVIDAVRRRLGRT